MPHWNYWHRVEYNLVHDDGSRTHEYSELADDQGWLFRHNTMSREEYLVYYTRACAIDYLDRVHATPGTHWVVAVYRLTDSGERKPVCSIRLKY